MNRKGLHEAVGEEVKLHGCIEAESAPKSTLHWRLLQPEIRRTSKDKRDRGRCTGEERVERKRERVPAILLYPDD